MKTRIKSMFKQATLWLKWQWCQILAARQVAKTKLEYPGTEDAMNAWPTPGTGVAISGVTTVRWGTTGLLQSPKPASGFYVVTRFSQRALVTNNKYPNGDGITSTRAILTDGVQWDLTVRDDTALVPPQPGDSITVVDGAGLIEGTTAGAVKTFAATVVDSGADGSPGNPFERTITCENLVLVESQTGGAQVSP